MEPTPAPPAREKAPFLKGKRLSSGIVAGGAAFAMTLAGLGIANAQTDDATPPSTSTPAPADGARHHRGPGPGARPEALAKALGITVEELKAELAPGTSIADVAAAKGVDLQKVIDALVADAKAHLAEEVAEGDLTQAEADARSATLTDRITELVNRARPVDGPRGGDGDHKGPGRAGPAGDPKVIASALQMTPAELKAALDSGKSLAAIATDKGIPVASVVDALVADAKAHLAQAVTDGKITQAQADEHAATLTERMTDFVNRTPPFGHGRGDGPGPRDGAKPNLEAAASALGLSADDLRTELQAGKSLATIAGERNVDVAKVVDALVADAKARLAQAVTDGKLTQAQADERAAKLTERITAIVDHTGGAHDGPRHHDGPDDDDTQDGTVAPAVLEA